MKEPEGSIETEPPKQTYDRDFYAKAFEQATRAGGRAALRPVRCALVAKENCCKTGLALELARAGGNEGEIHIFDIDSSAENTVDYVYPDDKDIFIHRLFDETDGSIFHDDNSTDWVGLVDKVSWFVNVLGERAAEGKVAAVIFDGGSTFLKWCEFAMSRILMERENAPIDMDSDRFNQAEWRVRNKLFKNTINRINSLPVSRVFFTFHLKDVKNYVDLGNGTKGLMKIGEKVDWPIDTQRLFSQQIWLNRYMKEEDEAAGVKADPKLGPNDWAVKATIEEMKGRYTEHLGETHTVIEVKKGKVNWTGLSFLTWENGDQPPEDGVDEDE